MKPVSSVSSGVIFQTSVTKGSMRVLPPGDRQPAGTPPRARAEAIELVERRVAEVERALDADVDRVIAEAAKSESHAPRARPLRPYG